mmetsp:Transcript_48472/g.140399  ORF Transcript_48472/g.140399 Transcript_48472/m.140399 type:complete len:218 (+) Transcript_48472:588-1241(+)
MSGPPLAPERVISSSKVAMDMVTLRKWLRPTEVSSRSTVKLMAPMYTMRPSRMSTTLMARKAMAMARTMTMSSFSSLSTRASLSTRRSRRILNTTKAFKLAVASVPVFHPKATTNKLTIQVSRTIKNTRKASNMIQNSLTALRIFLNAKTRMRNSTRNSAQNALATTWKPRSASIIVAASLWSISMPIHTALRHIMIKEMVSKTGLLAKAWRIPVSR